ncbi:MAG: hypothetical protein ABFD03_04645 [Clostridiaceae bacterium]
MLTQPATPELIESWKRTFAQYKDRLRPNRKSGTELKEYLAAKYPLREETSARAHRVVTGNILGNKPLANELPPGKQPEPYCAVILRQGAGNSLYAEQDEVFSGVEIFVGIDLVSGYFLVEGSSLLWDELFAFRGLNEKDLENYYLVAEYVACLKRFNLLGSV